MRETEWEKLQVRDTVGGRWRDRQREPDTEPLVDSQTCLLQLSLLPDSGLAGLNSGTADGFRCSQGTPPLLLAF